MKLSTDAVWRATRTPLGPGTERLTVDRSGTVHVHAWGAGAEWLVEHAPALIGELDDDSDFRPNHPLIRDLWRLPSGLRSPPSEAGFQAPVAPIPGQMGPGAGARGGRPGPGRGPAQAGP